MTVASAKLLLFQHINTKIQKKGILSHKAIIKLEQENIAQWLLYSERNNASWNTVQYYFILELFYELLLGGSEDDLMLLHSCLPTVWYQVSEATQAFLAACFAVDSSESHTLTS